MDLPDLNTFRSIRELEAHRAEIRQRITKMHTDAAGVPFNEEQRADFKALVDRDGECSARITEFEGREAIIANITNGATAERDTEPPAAAWSRDSVREPSLYGGAPGTRRVVDPYDLSDLRMDPFNPGAGLHVLRERAMVAADRAAYPGVDSAVAKARIEYLLSRHSEDAEVASLILRTGRPEYQRAFGKYVCGIELTGEERTALATGAGAQGGFAVPFVLDPTVILTSDGSINPFRQIARVETITSNEWRGITSAGVTVARALEAAEASDNAPELAQPSVKPDRVQGFIPFSIEIGQDWPSLQAEITRMLQDAKDDEETQAFTTQNGSPPNSEGLLYALDNPDDGSVIVDTATIGTLAAADLYTLQAALPPRWRARASWMANLAQLNRVRQFDTSGGAQLWAQLGEDTPDRLLGKPVYENTAMDSTVSANSKLAVYGDFSQYIIVDRIGMSVEVIQHLFGASNNFPTGQRGFYAYWRNRGEVLVETAFRVLESKAS